MQKLPPRSRHRLTVTTLEGMLLAAVVFAASACTGTLEAGELQSRQGNGPDVPSIVVPPAADAGPDTSPGAVPPGESFTADAAPAPAPDAAPPSSGTCNSNADCKKIGRDSCNSKHRCIEGGKQGNACQDERTDCRDGYYCCPIFKQCFERCSPAGTCPDTGKQCMTVFINKLCIG